jgi:signal transduction histidine kinase
MPADRPPVRADHRRLLQVFQRLSGNTLKFTPAGGSIPVGVAAQDEAAEFLGRIPRSERSDP